MKQIYLAQNLNLIFFNFTFDILIIVMIRAHQEGVSEGVAPLKIFSEKIQSKISPLILKKFKRKSQRGAKG
jgi:hypothetical protein